MIHSIRCVLVLGVMCAWSAIAAERYAVTDLGTMGLDQAHVTGINSKGTVVGFAETFRLFGKREVRPFIYKDGTMIDLYDTIVNALPKECHLDNGLHPTITDSGLVEGWADCGGLSRYTRKHAIFSYRDGTVGFRLAQVLEDHPGESESTA
jgi:probable HAF family extracellular repeat protein